MIARMGLAAVAVAAWVGAAAATTVEFSFSDVDGGSGRSVTMQFDLPIGFDLSVGGGFDFTNNLRIVSAPAGDYIGPTTVYCFSYCNSGT